jgi:hypothetical protein
MFSKAVYLYFVFLLSLTTLVAENQEDKYKKVIQPFMSEYCIRCHGEDKQKADRRVDTLNMDFSKPHDAMLWQEILDQLNMGEMPSKKPYPSEMELKTVTNWITKKLQKAREDQLANASGTSLRRLSHAEYSNTLKDLFNFQEPHFILANGLPEDKLSHAFHNNAKLLKHSPYLYERYLEIADKLLDRVLLPREMPKPIKWEIVSEDMRGGRDVPVYHKNKHGKSYADLIGRQKMTSRCWVEDGFRAPIGGTYKLTIHAEAIGKDNPEWKRWGTPKIGTDYILGVYATSKDYGQISAPNISDYLLNKTVVDAGPQKKVMDVYLKKGHSPYFIWENGMGGAYSGIISNVARKHYGENPSAYLKYGRWEVTDRFYKNDEFLGPRIRIHKIDVEGPFYDSWPPVQTKSVFPDGIPNKLTDQQYSEFLHQFATKAWRRPVKNHELDSLTHLGLQIMKKDGIDSALRVGLKGILVAPGFLSVPQNDGDLDAHSLASRLSYFLFNTLPDQNLKALASSGELMEKDVYQNQVISMLKDSRSKIFIESFVHQWLNFDRIAIMQPDKNKFKKFYSSGAASYYTREAKEFIYHLMKENLSVYNCLNSDFVMINSALAKHYGIKDVKGRNFRPVILKDNSIRGGLVTQAAVMAATSNGVDSSPITRGIWIMENILGTPPPAPPEDVEPLDPDIRGAKTLVEQLELHRKHAACNDCHAKIDPLGMPLEVLNPVGLFRKTYEGPDNHPVLSKATLHSGKTIANIKEYKEFLMDQKEKFSQCITEKLLEYATGRKMTYLERDEINNIVQGLEQKHGFQDLLIAVVNSPIFKHR